MRTADVEPRAVASLIAKRLQSRLCAIDGRGEMVFDVQRRVYLKGPQQDTTTPDLLPAIFVMRRLGGGATRTVQPGKDIYSDTTIVWDVIGILAANENDTIAGEEFMADMVRALEIPEDPFLSLSCDGKKPFLLNQELTLIDVFVGDQIAALPFDIVGHGVSCTHPHQYGRPNAL
jgi:hypothetical protein